MHFRSLLLLVITLFIVSSAAFCQKGCDPHIWEHVYDKDWLHVKKVCMQATGVVYMATNGEDNNINIRLLLDKGQERLINDKNVSDQYGCLLVSSICKGEVDYPDAVDPCEGFDLKVSTPPRGAHVRVTGVYVYNELHGWYEIHPVSSIEVIP